MAPLQSERLVNRLVIAGVVTGFLILIVVGAITAQTVQRSLSYADLVSHTHEVQSALGDYRVLSERLEAARRGYLISQEASFQKVYDNTARDLPEALERIARLTFDNPRQRARVARLRVLTEQQLTSGRDALQNQRTAQDFARDEGVLAIREGRALTAAMDAEEGRLLSIRDAERASGVLALRRVALLGAVLLVLVAASSTMVVLRYTRDLAKSQGELEKLNAGLEDAVKTRTADLQRANDEIQRFAYIVSHDLRSPLVNVMGFTSELEASAKPLGDLLTRAEGAAPEVVTPDARRAVREDLPEAIGFIRSSTQKMDRLINAILQLSRQGRRVLTPERLEMTRVLTSVADGLQHRTQELGGSVQVEGGAPNIVSDRLALEQVFSNLVENAIKYAKPGRPPHVVLRGRREGGRAIFEVEDNGRGIDPKDHERIFELFRRAGVQDQPGEGIGLAHVRALIYRLGGLISVDSRLDQGSTFRVSLPMTLSAEGADQ